VRLLNTISVVLLAGALFLYFHDPAPEQPVQVELPELTVGKAGGAPEVVCDDGELQSVFAAMGLPDPPRFSGSDPVSANVIMERVKAWQETGSPEILGELGMIFLAVEENRAALEYLAAARATSDDHWWTYFLAATCQKMGYREQAISLLDTFVARQSDYGTAFARLGLMQLELGQLDQAEKSYARCRELMPRESLAYLGLGRVALAGGDAGQAVEQLSKAVELANDFIAYRFLGMALMAVGREDEAREASRTAELLPQYSGWLQFDPRLARAHEMAQSQRFLENRLRTALGANDLATAVDTYQQLIERRPDNPGDRDNLASLYLMARKLPEAVQVLDEALELFPGNGALLFNRARTMFMQRNYEEALRLVDASMRASAENAPALDLKGRILYQQGRAADGIAAMERSLKMDPTKAGTHLALGKMCMDTHRPERAREAFHAVLRIDPNHGQAKTMLAALDNPG